MIANYEINTKAMAKLSIADLCALEHRFLVDNLKHTSVYDYEAIGIAKEFAGIFAAELDKRIDSIIIIISNP